MPHETSAAATKELLSYAGLTDLLNVLIFYHFHFFIALNLIYNC